MAYHLSDFGPGGRDLVPVAGLLRGQLAEHDEPGAVELAVGGQSEPREQVLALHLLGHVVVVMGSCNQ